LNVRGRSYRTIWVGADGASVEAIDQTRLPHSFETVRLTSAEDAVRAIRDMVVRGAPLIGAAGAYGMWLAARESASADHLAESAGRLRGARPTARNLGWSVDRLLGAVLEHPEGDRAEVALAEAESVADEDVRINAHIADVGFELLARMYSERGGRPLDILTHCNAGWLATVDWGTALAPVYRAREAGIDVHVWVDETRPRNQGAALTAWELSEQGVAHTVVVDNAGGHLMQTGRVDACIVGTDRTAANGDVCNKIGTYLKALAAEDNGVPFYVALPGPTIDWDLDSGGEIPIEEREAGEVTEVGGRAPDGSWAVVSIAPAGTRAANPAFDVTPARLVTAFITERGVAPASADGLRGLYPERGSPLPGTGQGGARGDRRPTAQPRLAGGGEAR
jgi:methylthioribose-1-phosphate isomerase